MPGRRKHKSAEKAPRVYRMAHWRDRWYWHNKEGRWIDVDLIPDEGIKKLLGMLDERGPKEYCLVMEEVARRRGLIEDDGRRRIPEGDGAGVSTA